MTNFRECPGTFPGWDPISRDPDKIHRADFVVPVLTGWVIFPVGDMSMGVRAVISRDGKPAHIVNVQYT